MSLFSNIIKQRYEMLSAGKRPRALRIDLDSLSALEKELRGSALLLIPGQKILGLTIEYTSEPNFEVVT
jgi:hypothetical protein